MTTLVRLRLPVHGTANRWQGGWSSVVLVALLLGGVGHTSARVAFERYVAVTGVAEYQTVLTGFLLGGPVADLAVVTVDGQGERRVRIYVLDDGAWKPRGESVVLPRELSFVDVATIEGHERLITYEPGRISVLDLETGASRPLVAVPSNFEPPRRGPIPHADITRDVNRDGRDDLVVPGDDGFRVFVQTSGGEFRDAVTVGPPAGMANIYGADGYRYDPWSESRIHVADYDGDGRPDLTSWNGDHFEVHRQDARGGFSSDPEIVASAVHFDSDDPSWLATGDMQGRVLDALTEVNGDGIADLVIRSLQGRRVGAKDSAVEVHFGIRRPGRGIAFGTAPDTVIRTEGIQLGVERHDIDRDGQLDTLVTTIAPPLLRGTLFRRFAGFMGGEIPLQLEFFRMVDGRYPDAPGVTRRINLQYPGAHRGPGWVPLDVALRGATHERRLTEAAHPRAFNTPVLVGDVTGDGRADLLIGRDRGEPPGPRRHADDSLHVFVGEPAPDLFSRVPHELDIPLPEDGEYVWLADLDRDGRQDVVIHQPSPTEPHRVTVLMAR